MTRNVALIFTLAVVGLGTAACSTDPESSPVAPTSFATEAVEVAATAPDTQTLVTLKGVVRDLNAQRHQFTLVVRSDGARPTPAPRIIRIDERTEFWAGGHRVRRRAIERGMNCEVTGLDNGDFVLARKITLLRRDGR